MKNNKVMLEVWGDFALFTRPELKVERYSYDVMTPSSARAILEAIMWKPAIKYIIDKIQILSPIKRTVIWRNETQQKMSLFNVRKAITSDTQTELNIDTRKSISQRSENILKDVHYVIEAHFVMTEQAGEHDNVEKFKNMINRRIEKGQCFHMPYFGCRDYSVNFKPVDETTPSPINLNQNMGIMLYDIDYSGNEKTPIFFNANVVNGVLDVAGGEIFR